MKKIFKSEKLLDLGEMGYVEPNPALAQPDNQSMETRMKDAKTLFLL